MDDDALQILSAAFPFLNASTIACASCSSSSCNLLLSTLVRSCGSQLLLRVCQEIASEQQQTKQCRRSWYEEQASDKASRSLKKQLSWLLRMAPGAAAAVDVPALLSIGHLPLHVAESLLKAGTQISFKQLVAAAQSRVPGLEVWLQAAPRVPGACSTDVPEVLFAMATSKTEGRMQLLHDYCDPVVSDPALPDLLHVAANCSAACRAAQALAYRLLLRSGQRLLAEQPGLAVDLLTTAVMRNHIDLVWKLCRTAAVQAIGPSTLLALLQTALQSSALGVLCSLPCAAQLTAADVLDLLSAAVITADADRANLHRLCKLPAAAMLPGSAALQLVHSAAKNQGWFTAALLRRWLRPALGPHRRCQLQQQPNAFRL